MIRGDELVHRYAVRRILGELADGLLDPHVFPGARANTQEWLHAQTGSDEQWTRLLELTQEERDTLHVLLTDGALTVSECLDAVDLI